MQKNKRHFGVLVLLLLTGAAFRIFYLRVHGLDPDETWTLGLFQGQISALLADFSGTVIEVDPKLYYILHYPWFLAAGFSEVAARLPNIIMDLILGALLMQTARARFGMREALIVGLLWSINPLLLWVSGMVRMYSMLTLLAVAAWLFMIRALSEDRRRWWFAFVITALGAAYTHVLGFFVIASSGAVLVFWMIKRRQWGIGLILAILGTSYLPSLLSLWSERTNTRHLGSVPQNPFSFLLSYGVGLIANQLPVSSALLWLIVILCLLVLGLAWKSKVQVEKISLISILLIVSLGSAYLALQQTIFETMYIAYIVPLFILGIAVGVNQIPGTLIRGIVLVVLSIASITGLYYQSAPNARDDFRSVAGYVETFSDRQDIVLVMSSYARETFSYYYQGYSEVIAPWMRILPDTSLDELRPLLEKPDTIWLVLRDTNVSDPDNRLDGWFRARYPIRTEAFPSGATIRAYDLRPMTAALPSEAKPLDVVFGTKVALRGYQAYQSAVAARDERLHPPSGWIHITLYWEVLENGVQFDARPQVENAMSELYGVAFTRGTETFIMYPPATWKPGQVWRTDYDINLNPATPSGEYKIVVRIFGPDTPNMPWAITDGSNTGATWLILETVTITK